MNFRPLTGFSCFHNIYTLDLFAGMDEFPSPHGAPLRITSASSPPPGTAPSDTAFHDTWCTSPYGATPRTAGPGNACAPAEHWSRQKSSESAPRSPLCRTADK